MYPVTAQGIVDALKPDIRQFHELSEGNIESIGLLFSEMARQPLPPQVICKILGMNEEDVKAAFEEGKPPTASLPMLEDAVLKSVDLVLQNPLFLFSPALYLSTACLGIARGALNAPL